MIDRTELLRMIMEANPSQAPAFVLEQYVQYLKGLEDIHGSNFAVSGTVSSCECTDAETPAEAVEPKAKKRESITCGFTKRSLKIKPDDAILDDKILCCICGKECQALTERHLASHNGLSREGYIKLCGYPANQALMSKKHLHRMKANVLKAQEARKAKKKAAE